METIDGGRGREQPSDPPYLVPHSREAIRVIYDDLHLLLVIKPDLLLSVPGRHPKNHDCLISRLQRDYEDALIVHRLDLDTSGVMLIARGKAALRDLSSQFQQRRVQKRYEALVDGVVRDESGLIELPIARDWPNRPLQKICAIEGRNAITRFEVLERHADCTRLGLYPITGRTHQLRIHCRELGHPILGCDMYAPGETLGRAPRLMLHATDISFQHPVTGRELHGFSPAPF